MTRLAVALMRALCCAGQLAAGDAPPATLRGRVLDAQTGEPIARALVSLPALGREALTAGDGTFAVPDLAVGEVQLVVTTVGYGLVQTTVVVGPGLEPIEIRVGQEALKRSEDVVVEAAPFEPVDPAAPNAHTLGGVELRNLASVLADDPLRSVQSLPGVAAGDDFYASFASRGAGFASVGFYIDGVPTSAPFHTILDANDAYSLTILNGDIVESLTFISGAAPARYGDRTGAVLNVETREGNREEFSGRASLGASGAYATVEGPLGAGRNRAQSGAERFYSRSTQWGTRADVLRVDGAHRFEAGSLFRGLSGRTRDVDGPAPAPIVTEARASAPQWGGYLQDTWSTPGGRVWLTLGGRFDRFGETDETRFLPRASASLGLTSTTKASVAYGDYAQFPSFLQLRGAHGNSATRS